MELRTMASVEEKTRLLCDSGSRRPEDEWPRVLLRSLSSTLTNTESREYTCEADCSGGGSGVGSRNTRHNRGTNSDERNLPRTTSRADIAEYLESVCHQLLTIRSALELDSAGDTTDGGAATNVEEVGNSDHEAEKDEVQDLVGDYSTTKVQNTTGRRKLNRSQSVPWLGVDKSLGTEDLLSGLERTQTSSSRSVLPGGGGGGMSNGNSRAPSMAGHRLSTQTILSVQKFLQNPGLKGWSVVSNLPSKITFCQPVTCVMENILYVCGRCVHKPGGPEAAVLWEVSFSEYTALNWEEASLPATNATDCLAVFMYEGCLHVVLIGARVFDDPSVEMLSVWRRSMVQPDSPPEPSPSASSSSNTLQHGFSRRTTSLHNTKRKDSGPKYDWVLVAERQWKLYQFTTVPVNGKLVFAGGRDGAGRSTNVVLLDLAAKEWTDWPPLPEGICGAVGSVWKGQVLLLGGYTGRGLGKPQRKVYALDLESSQTRMWYSTSFAQVEAGGCGAVAINGEVMILAGSRDVAHLPGDEVYVLSEDGRFWFPLAGLKQRRCAPVLACIGNRLLCFGGENGASLRTTIEAFDLSYFHLNE